MGFLNRRKIDNMRQQAHLNWMGGPSYDIHDPLVKLRLAASSCFFGEPMYYQQDATDTRPRRLRYRGALTEADRKHLREMLHAVDPQEWRDLTPAALMEQAIDEALAADAEHTLQEAVRLRQEEHMRVTPQVILVRAAQQMAVKGTGLIRRYAPDIIQRGDEPAVGLAYQMEKFGKPIPNALKRAWRDALEKFDSYQMAKYRMEGRQVKTVDVVNVVHPKSEAVNRLAKGDLKITDQTWEALISAKGASRESWQEALKLMGHMALLRNLRNLLQHDVPVETFLEKLLAGASDGKQLPFRYYSAYRSIEKLAPPTLLDALEDCMKQTLGNLPFFTGRVISLCDNSGSARGTATSSMGRMQIATIGNLTGVITGMQATEGYVGIFGDRLETFAVRKRSSIFNQLNHAEQLGEKVGGSTENGVWLFWDKAIREKQHWDYVFIYSDMQAGHGGLYGTNSHDYRDFIWGKGGHYIDVPKLIAAYRTQVNPNVQVFLVQIAGYQDTLLPEFYDRTYILGGWGEGLLRFAAEMSRLN